MNVSTRAEQPPTDREAPAPSPGVDEGAGQPADASPLGSTLQPAPIESEGSDPAAADPRAELTADNLNSMVHSPIPQTDAPDNEAPDSE